MVLVLSPEAPEYKIADLVQRLEADGFAALLNRNGEETILCLIGDTGNLDPDELAESNDIVASARRIQEPYKAVNRRVHPQATLVQAGNTFIGEGRFTVISGPCSVESREQILEVAKSVKASGAAVLRGGVFKPRTSPYSFQGLQEEGLAMLLEAKQETGLPVVTEIMNQTQLSLMDHIDMIQIGARNMQNFDLLREVGKSDKPVLLKRGLANTIEELLMSAEYILSEGNQQVILCERGIRTFETMTRNTLDLSAVPLLKEKTHLPVIVDPSHAAGIRRLVAPLSKAAIAVGADGLMVETSSNPSEALSDGKQSLDLKQFEALMIDIRKRAEFEGKLI